MLWQRMVIDQLNPSPRTGTSRWRQRRSRVGQETGAGLAGAKPCQHVGYLHFRSWPIEKASCPTADSCVLYNGTVVRLTDVMLLPAKAAKTLAKTCAAMVTLGAAFTPSNAQAVTTWNWSFSAGYGYSGSGTFTTSDVALGQHDLPGHRHFRHLQPGRRGWLYNYGARYTSYQSVQMGWNYIFAYTFIKWLAYAFIKRRNCFHS